jgi:hypothetical protein
MEVLMMRTKALLRLATGIALVAGVMALSGSAAFASAVHLPATAANPALTGPSPPTVTIPSNCPAFVGSDAWVLNFVSGNAVSYGTSNKNGDWGGGNAEGIGLFQTSDGTVQYHRWGASWKCRSFSHWPS